MTVRSARRQAPWDSFGRSLDHSDRPEDKHTVGVMPAVFAGPMIRVTFFYLLLAAVLWLSWHRGRREERVAAIVCVLGTLLTVVTSGPLVGRFANFSTTILLVDLGVLAAFLVIALRSDRFWPIWVSGLQLTATSVHLFKLINPGLMSFVFGAALAFWSYPILMLIAIGAWRTHIVERWRNEARLPEAL